MDRSIASGVTKLPSNMDVGRRQRYRVIETESVVGVGCGEGWRKGTERWGKLWWKGHSRRWGGGNREWHELRCLVCEEPHPQWHRELLPHACLVGKILLCACTTADSSQSTTSQRDPPQRTTGRRAPSPCAVSWWGPPSHVGIRERERGDKEGLEREDGCGSHNKFECERQMGPTDIFVNSNAT